MSKILSNTTFIYALLDPRDGSVKYIGKSKNVKSRYSYHINEYKSKKISKKINWIKSLRKLDLKPELLIIDEVEDYSWQFWEIHYISLFKFYGFDLKNSTNGGEKSGNHKGMKRTESTKEKMRLAASKRGKDFYENMVEKRRLNGNWIISLSKKEFTDKHKENIRLSKINMNDDVRRNMKNNNWLRTPIIRLDINGLFLKEYESASDAAREIHGHPSGASYILKCIRENRLYKNSKWELSKKYHNENINNANI